MRTVEELRSKVHASVDKQESPEVLAYVDQILSAPVVWATKEEEEAIARGMSDIEAGNFLTLEEFLEQSKKDREERRLRSA